MKKLLSLVFVALGGAIALGQEPESFEQRSPTKPVTTTLDDCDIPVWPVGGLPDDYWARSLPSVRRTTSGTAKKATTSKPTGTTDQAEAARTVTDQQWEARYQEGLAAGKEAGRAEAQKANNEALKAEFDKGFAAGKAEVKTEVVYHGVSWAWFWLTAIFALLVGAAAAPAWRLKQRRSARQAPPNQ